MDEITNDYLKISDLPADNDVSGANIFAHSYNGYKAFENTAEVSKKVMEKIKLNDTDGLNLSKLRTSLFFYFRELRHTKSEPNIELINAHIDLIRRRIIKH